MPRTLEHERGFLASSPDASHWCVNPIGPWGCTGRACIELGRVDLQSLVRHHTFDSNEGKLCRTCQEGSALCRLHARGRRRSDRSTSAANFSPVTDKEQREKPG